MNNRLRDLVLAVETLDNSNAPCVFVSYESRLTPLDVQLWLSPAIAALIDPYKIAQVHKPDGNGGQSLAAIMVVKPDYLDDPYYDD
jgi:hypothetical protein